MIARQRVNFSGPCTSLSKIPPRARDTIAGPTITPSKYWRTWRHTSASTDLLAPPNPNALAF